MLLGAAAAASPQPPARATVRIAAASDLKFALDEVIRRFAAGHPSIRVEPTYGSSGTFHAQLRQRAPFDLYLSADLEYARDLVSRGIGSEKDLFTYAGGHLVIWVPRSSPLPVEREGLQALLRAPRVAIANPRHAPYGRAAEAALRAAGIWERIEPRLVLGENVAQAAQFVQSGAAAAGIIARSVTMAPAMRAAGRVHELPRSSHPEIRQGGLVLPWATSRTAALAVRDFLLGREGQAVLVDYGFDLPR